MEEVIKVLELLKQASHDLHTNPNGNSSSIKALLELHTQSHTILSDPHLYLLSHHLSSLNSLLHSPRHSFSSFLRRRQISRVAASIESELQAWIDRELVDSLVKALHVLEDETQLIHLLTRFQERLSQGFNPELQELLLKSTLFSDLEALLTNSTHSTRLREESAFAIEALIRFNKNVFVGQVSMGPTTKALITMGSASSLRVLCSLIKSIKSPVVDEIQSKDQIGVIIGYMSSEEREKQEIGLECVMEIGYYGRKEAVEAMMNAKVVEKLVELQRSEMEEERHPFGSCVARFSVQLEVGQGLRQREKRAFKQEILSRIKDASLSHDKLATIQAQVLWGSFS